MSIDELVEPLMIDWAADCTAAWAEAVVVATALEIAEVVDPVTVDMRRLRASARPVKTVECAIERAIF
ncbi:hypothetical protein [Paraburkholderia atlantica]|uniref:hypothetical protein n=1 Tax=Paraburkholderia TaxID=1822464 RepID=UPI001EE640C2|nr:hypothetical protein [Paraburkholderia atlantica]